MCLRICGSKIDGFISFMFCKGFLKTGVQPSSAHDHQTQLLTLQVLNMPWLDGNYAENVVFSKTGSYFKNLSTLQEDIEL